MSGERVVVTGGEGFLGSFVVERLRGTEWCSEVFVPRSRDYDLRILWDTSKPNGQPRRCLDAYRADQEFGWRAQTKFDEGLCRTIEWYKAYRRGS